MRKKHSRERLEALRERLYSRGSEPRERERTKLSDIQAPDESEDIPTEWEDTPRHDPAPETLPPAHDTMAKKVRSYRGTILITAVSFFVAAVVLSSLFIMFGGNSISGENISISINGPFTVGGGEEIPLQVGITNQNSVPIESATLIVEYPEGTQAADEGNRELFIERVPLDVIRSGETVNIPLRARVFGDENEELEIRASVEYRVAGSNATFFKEAEPLRFKITSSPVSIDVDAVESLAAGQTYEMELTVRSNASTPLENLLVRAEYPEGFDFTSSVPTPIAGQNTWRIESLAPEEETTITIRGVVAGTESDTRVTRFSIGVPNDRDQFSLASVFSTASAEVSIEEPFMDVDVLVNGRSSDMTAEPGERSDVVVRIRNSLDDAVYNAEVSVKLAGAGIANADVRTSTGFYDSNTQTVIWDTSSDDDLAELLPGEQEEFRFSIEPDEEAGRTPQFELAASVFARRVRESSVSESLLGSTEAVVRITSSVDLIGETAYGSAGLMNTGPVPPVVGETTTYTLSLQVVAGSNEVADATVTASLPTYVTWLETTSGNGSFTYNGASRTVTWEAGDIDANASAIGSFQVSILPSASQIGTTPTLLGEQRLRATDRFTGEVIRATSPALTTWLSSEAGFGGDSGRVRAQE